MHADDDRYRLRLDGGPDSPGVARRAVTQWLGAVLGGDALDDARLLVSELVTNGVRHAPRGPQGLELRVALRRSCVRVEVVDPGQGFEPPPPRVPPPHAAGGRGLVIVDRLAARWGVGRGAGTSVWFELDT